MRAIITHYGYFEKLTESISEFYKQYSDFIRIESSKSSDAELFERYIASPNKAYPDIADDCGVTVYKLRKTVDLYEKKFHQYSK